MKGGFNSKHKIFIREYWNKPLIKFLSKKEKDKLIYMGLPSSSAEDINQWLEFIKIVIAFQCRVYGTESAPEQTKSEIDKLNSLLRQLERERKIENYVVYDGYLEEVVLRGFDNSRSSISFKQNDFTTLYNLDFCNDIASPIIFADKNGNEQTAYKFNAIQKLLEIQNSLREVSKKFLFLLTVQCSYRGKELENFLNNPPNKLIESYLKKFYTLKGHEKNARIVRLFVCYYIDIYFKGNNFSYHILPVIQYKGLGGNELLHFVVLGTAPQLTASGIATFQSINEVIDQKLVSIDSDNFTNIDSELGENDIPDLNPINIFTSSKTFKSQWN